MGQLSLSLKTSKSKCLYTGELFWNHADDNDNYHTLVHPRKINKSSYCLLVKKQQADPFYITAELLPFELKLSSLDWRPNKRATPVFSPDVSCSHFYCFHAIRSLPFLRLDALGKELKSSSFFFCTTEDWAQASFLLVNNSELHLQALLFSFCFILT
jgi:hypothetical protein